jgi:hypothetical protein
LGGCGGAGAVAAPAGGCDAAAPGAVAAGAAVLLFLHEIDNSAAVTRIVATHHDIFAGINTS